MKKITFNQVNEWVRDSDNPLNGELEQFQQAYFGDFRHKYYRFFYHMVAETKPKIALEIGIEHGHTIVHMAAAHSNTLVAGIDKNIRSAKDAPKYPNVRYIFENSLQAEETIATLVKRYGEIGVVFQDSSHHYEASQQEFQIYSQYLDNNAIWCCDDILDAFHDPLIDPPGKGMVQYFNELPGRKKLYSNLHHGSVIGVILL